LSVQTIAKTTMLLLSHILLAIKPHCSPSETEPCLSMQLLSIAVVSRSRCSGIEADTEESGQSSDANPNSGEIGGKDMKEKSEKWVTVKGQQPIEA
jgi:hypothetical protein